MSVLRNTDSLDEKIKIDLMHKNENPLKFSGPKQSHVK